MEHRSRSNGLETFLEHWGFVVVAIVVVLASQVLMFFMRLSGTPWIWFFVASFALMTVGGGLISCAKFPAYRRAGDSSLLESSQSRYIWPDIIAGAGECFYSVSFWDSVCYCRGHDVVYQDHCTQRRMAVAVPLRGQRLLVRRV